MAISQACRDNTGSCSSELRQVRTLAREIWGTRVTAKNRSELINYRFCQDFKSCFERDCFRVRAPRLSYGKFKSASRPFIMLNQSAEPARGTVVFAHGLSDSPYSGGAIAEFLSKKGFNVVALLLSNHGGDHRPNRVSDFNEWRADIDNGVRLATRLFGSKGIAVSGFSTGGAIAIDFFERHPASQKFIGASVLFDPALALPWMAESALRNEGLMEQTLRQAGELQEWWNDENGKDVSPARFTMKGTRDAVPLMKLLDEIRQRRASISVPTLAVLSNGRWHAGQTIDPVRTKAELLGPEDGRPALLAGEREILDYGQPSDAVSEPVGHSQLVTRESLGFCRPPYPMSPNPYFSRMMEEVTRFLDQHLPRVVNE